MDADRVGPRGTQLADRGQVARAVRTAPGSATPAAAARTARTHRARWVAPRSLPAEVPVVITSCRTPSRRTAASATSASSAGRFTATVAPLRKRLLDGTEPAALGLVVADAGLHDRRGQHVGAVQPGDLLVADPFGRGQVVEPWSATTVRTSSPVSTPSSRIASPSSQYGLFGFNGTVAFRPSISRWPSLLGPAPAPRLTGAAVADPEQGQVDPGRLPRIGGPVSDLGRDGHGRDAAGAAGQRL